jgi:hypothetical protein
MVSVLAKEQHGPDRMGTPLPVAGPQRHPPSAGEQVEIGIPSTIKL